MFLNEEVNGLGYLKENFGDEEEEHGKFVLLVVEVVELFEEEGEDEVGGDEKENENDSTGLNHYILSIVIYYIQHRSIIEH